MSENKKDPAAGWTHEGGGVWVPPLRKSEGATLEPAGPSGSLACSGVVGLLRQTFERRAATWEKDHGQLGAMVAAEIRAVSQAYQEAWSGDAKQANTPSETRRGQRTD